MISPLASCNERSYAQHTLCKSPGNNDSLWNRNGEVVEVVSRDGYVATGFAANAGTHPASKDVRDEALLRLDWPSVRSSM